ncbi:MAG: serine--tRNA ligase, partial [Planctomycetia bacterium]
MLDIAFIRSNPDAVKSNCKNRNVAVDVDRVIAIDDERRKLLSQIQTIQQKQNELSKEIPKEKDPAK